MTDSVGPWAAVASVLTDDAEYPSIRTVVR